MIKHCFCLVIIVMLLTSCGYQLNQDSIQWNPYKAGDILIFESNTNTLDTLAISDIENYQVGKNEILKVNCDFVNHTSNMNRGADTIHSFLMALTAWENEKAVLTININTKSARFAPFNAKSIAWLDSLHRDSLTINNNIYKDILTLKPDKSSSKYQNDSLYVSKVIWSKTNGLISYELKNKGIVWMLKKKYNPARELTVNFYDSSNNQK